MLSKAIENAQRKVEAHNFEIRKHLLEYDDVMNKQREVIYSQRKQIMKGENLRDEIMGFIEEIASVLVSTYADEKAPASEWDWEGLAKRLKGQFAFGLDLTKEQREDITAGELEEHLSDLFKKNYAKQVELFGPEEMARAERFLMLQVLDGLWKDHLLNMDHLRDGIGLRGYGQKDPLQEYKREGFDMFMDMIQRFREETVSILLRIVPMRQEEVDAMEEKRRMQQERELRMSHGGEEGAKQQPVRRKTKKVGRNQPCPCGSGKKYKKCCGRK